MTFVPVVLRSGLLFELSFVFLASHRGRGQQSRTIASSFGCLAHRQTTTGSAGDVPAASPANFGVSALELEAMAVTACNSVAADHDSTAEVWGTSLVAGPLLRFTPRVTAMQCQAVMKHDVERCLEDALVAEAATAMRDRSVGFLHISGSLGVAVGTLTDRDIAIRAIAESRQPDATRVGDVMTREVVTCSPSDDLAVAEDLMMRFQIARIVCVDGRRRPVGVISLSDVAKLGDRGHAGSVASSVASREAISHLNRPTEVRRATCRQVMTSRVECLGRDASATAAAMIMRKLNIGFLPICNDRGAAVGALTDRDLVVRVIAARRPLETPIGDVMTPGPIHCSADDPLSVAESLMARFRKSRIVCVDARSRPIGVVSLSDIARVERFDRVSRVLRDVATRPFATA
jgi:CBS domain-containing protein